MNRFKTLAVAVLSLVWLAAPSAYAQNSAQQLQGSWVLTFGADPNVHSAQPGVGVMQFTRDGGVTELLNTIMPPGLMTTDGLGEWARVGENQFVATVVFAVASGTPGVGPIGFFKQHFSLRYSADRTELTASYQWALTGMDGTPFFGGEGTAILRRIGVANPF